MLLKFVEPEIYAEIIINDAAYEHYSQHETAKMIQLLLRSSYMGDGVNVLLTSIDAVN